MFKLILKDLKYYIISYLLVFPLLTFYWNIKKDSVAFILIVFVQTMIMGALIVLPPLFAEQDEDANDGYTVLHVLPLTKKEIMGAKFLLPLLNALILFISNLLIYSFFKTDKEVIRIVNSIQILTIISCLLLIGIVYIFVARFGYTNFLRYSSAATLALAFLSIPVLSIFKVGFYELTQFFMNIFNKLNNTIALIAGLVLYTSLYMVSVWFERKV